MARKHTHEPEPEYRSTIVQQCACGWQRVNPDYAGGENRWQPPGDQFRQPRKETKP